jgi:hypothetical protein
MGPAPAFVAVENILVCSFGLLIILKLVKDPDFITGRDAPLRKIFEVS